MDVRQAVAARRSVRGFLDTPVPPAQLRDLAEAAARAPSGGNLQPWHVQIVQGDAMARLKALWSMAPAGRRKRELIGAVAKAFESTQNV